MVPREVFLREVAIASTVQAQRLAEGCRRYTGNGQYWEALEEVMQPDQQSQPQSAPVTLTMSQALAALLRPVGIPHSKPVLR